MLRVGPAGDARIPFSPPKAGTCACPGHHPQPCSPGRRFTLRTARPRPSIASSALRTGRFRAPKSNKLFLQVTEQTCTVQCCLLHYTLLTARHKHDMFKIEKIIAEKSNSKNYAGVNSSRNLSPANKSLKRKGVVLYCYENINASISGLNSIFSSNAKSKHPLSLI